MIYALMPDKTGRILFENPVSEKKFGNGFSVLHARVPAFSAASIRLFVNTGSVDEGEFSGCGISHFVEHMVFNGAGPRGKREIAEFVNSIGGTLNAYTYYDRTVYCLDCPSEALAGAFGILSDMVFNPHLKGDDFALERGVILREIDMCADDPDELLFSSVFARMYMRNPLRHPIIGHRRMFESLSLDDLKRYHKRRYAPENMFIAVSSNLADKNVFKAAEKFFGKRDCGRCETAVQPFEPVQIAPRETREYSDVEVARSCLAFKLPPAASAREDAALEAFSHAMGFGNSSLLVRKLKYGEALADSIDCDMMRVRGDRLFLVMWECEPAKNEEVRRRVLEEIRALCVSGLSRERLDRYARHCALQSVNSMRNSTSLSEWIVSLHSEGLDNSYLNSHISALGGLDAEKTAAILSESIDKDRSTFAAVLPKRLSRRTQKKALETDRPFEIKKLSNGLPVVLGHARHLEKFQARLVSAGGLQTLSLPEKGGLGLAALLILRDTKNRTAEELAEFLDDRAVSFNSEFGNALCAVSSESLAGEWKLPLDIMADAVLNLKIRRETFEAERSALISDVLEDLDDPQQAALRVLRREFFGKYPLSLSPDGDVADIKKASIKSVEGILAKNFNPASSALCISGKFDEKEVLEYCEELFGRLKGRAAKMPKPFKRNPRAEEKSVALKKNQSVVCSAFADVDVPDVKTYFARSVLLEILGGEDGIIFERVREREGLAYTAGASRISDFQSGMIYFHAASEKKSLGRIIEIFEETAKDASAGNFGAGRFENAKTAIKARNGANMQDPASWASAAGYSLLAFGRIFSEGEINAAIDAVTPAEVAALAEKLFKNPFVLKAL